MCALQWDCRHNASSLFLRIGITPIMADKILDASGLRCPMPLLKTKLELSAMKPGQELEVIATDAGSARDIPAFLKLSSHELLSTSESDGCYRFVIRCGG